MSETSQTPEVEEAEVLESQELAKIEPVQVPADSVNEEVTGDEAAAQLQYSEQAVISIVRLLLRHHGVRKSAAAIRDAVEMPHETFGPPQAVSALSALGFKSSFGSLKLSKLTEDFFPLIAFKKDGSSLLVYGPAEDGIISVSESEGKGKPTPMEAADFEKEFSGYVILAKELNRREKEERSGHWFFSAFRKSKWLYVQVMIAAMVSNFLSLSTSLFTMTVYDRIIPNGAFESLIALSIGVIIALGFDFLIKSLRAKFIDIASKRADLEISRRLFDRILTLTPSEQRQKTGAMAGTIREFETLREFFNSSTLVILIDLPFVFFFIYVIYLIAGPLAYVPLLAVPLVIIVGLGIQPFLARITKGSVESGMN